MQVKYAVGLLARILGILYCVMLGIGWFDEMQARLEPGNADLPPLIAFDRYAILTHLLPLAILLAGLIVGWHKPVWAAGAFGVYALLGVVMAWGEWIYVPLVSGPSLIIAALFALSIPKKSSAESPS